MRDEKRIKRILKIIEDKWKNVPDLRFGQLLINLGVLDDTIRQWRMDDDALEKHLKENDLFNKP